MKTKEQDKAYKNEIIFSNTSKNVWPNPAEFNSNWNFKYGKRCTPHNGRERSWRVSHTAKSFC